MKLIKLTQNKVSLVDDEDYNFLMGFKWYAYKHCNTYYARTNIQCLSGKRATIYMHMLVLDRMLGYEEGVSVSDHKDRNGINNQSYNLRRVSRNLNSHNKKISGKSKYRGVSWHKRSNKWQSRIGTDGVEIYLGMFDNEQDAAHVFDEAAREIYGDNAVLNFKKEN